MKNSSNRTLKQVLKLISILSIFLFILAKKDVKSLFFWPKIETNKVVFRKFQLWKLWSLPVWLDYRWFAGSIPECGCACVYGNHAVTGLNVARQNVADKMLRTKCRRTKRCKTKCRGQMVAKKTSHGQMVARTNCCMDKVLYGQNVAWTKCCTDR
jgi:hypothetical protein